MGVICNSIFWSGISMTHPRDEAAKTYAKKAIGVCYDCGEKSFKAGYDCAVTQQAQRIEELERALGFYADPKNWSRSENSMLYDEVKGTDCSDYPHIARDVRLTGGKLARQALKGEK